MTMIGTPVQMVARHRRIAGRARLLLACVLLTGSVCASADSSRPVSAAPTNSPFGQWSYTHEQLAAMVPEPRPEDVADPAAIVTALHESINGPKGHWDSARFRSLFLPNSVLADVAKSERGDVVIENKAFANVMKGVQDAHDKASWYEKVVKIDRVEEITKHGGRMAIVHYHSIAGVTLDKPEENGESMALLMNDGKRWWIITNTW